VSKVNDQINNLRSQAEAQLATAKTAGQELATVAQNAGKEALSVAQNLLNAVSSNAKAQLEAAKVGGSLNEQLQRQKELAATYQAPLKAAGEGFGNIAGSLKTNVLAVVK